MSETFGQRLRRLREARDLTQGELMAACGWKGSNSRITNYEQGLNEPKLSDIKLMADALEVTPEHLAYGDVGLVAAVPVLGAPEYPKSIAPEVEELLGIMEDLPKASRYRVLASAHDEVDKQKETPGTDATNKNKTERK